VSAPAFSLLSEGVQQAIFRLGWNELRPIQVESIQAVASTTDDLIIAARTAGGKTEAAFLPIISELERDPKKQAIYVGPLKALINDQFERLERLCEDIGVAVHRWHGDVSQAAKQRFRKNPGGILLITPESLESNFCNYGRAVPDLYGGLAFVVIDELHVFLNDVRGLHLASLLARLRTATGRNPRQIALSATLGDPDEARLYLRPDDPASVRLISDQTRTREVRVGLRTSLSGSENRLKPAEILNLFDSVVGEYWIRPKPLADAPFDSVRPPDTAQPDDDEDEPEEADDTEGSTLDEIAHDIASAFQEGTNLVFGNSRATLEELADKLHKIGEVQHWAYDPFVVHHGSISWDIRSDVESRLKSGRPTTALCTSTLELGIDIGDIRAIGQIDPPWSVAAFVQRLGRSGRKEGDPSIMRQYVREDAPSRESSLTDLLFPRLIRSMAIIELMLAKWLEPRGAQRLHLSTLVHQTLSLLRQSGSIPAAKLHQTLCVAGPFRAVTPQIYEHVLRSLGGKDIIEQSPNGDMLLGLVGEAIVSNYQFYASFASNEMFAVNNAGEKIGELHPTFVPPVGRVFLLAGRRWEVLDIDENTRTVIVRPGTKKAEVKFPGDPGDINTRIVAEMRRILSGSKIPAYLDPGSRLILEAARLAFSRAGLGRRPLLTAAGKIRWYPWLGTKGLLTLHLFAVHAKMSAKADELSLEFETSVDGLSKWLEGVVQSDVSAETLAGLMEIKEFERFDGMLKDDAKKDYSLLDYANARDRLDIAEAKQAAASCLEAMSGGGANGPTLSPEN
jgi:ATP-dependent Lhr-like helicase